MTVSFIAHKPHMEQSDRNGAAAPSASSEANDSPITVAELRRAAWTCSVGSALEYYDFALYSLASALVFGPLFFSHSFPGMGLIASFATYFLGFAVRPVGGIFFGALGDRVGRKTVLLLTVTLMGVASSGIGLIPTYRTIGVWAPILLVLMRMLQGFGAGAEQAGAAVMMTEYAPEGQRGFYAALPFLGVQVGTVLAGVIYFTMVAQADNITQTGLWRVPFLGSALILGVALYMRLKLKESPAFARMKEEQKSESVPLSQTIRTSWRTILAGFGLRMSENGSSSIYQVLAISYLVHTVGLSSRWGTLALIGAAVVGAVTIPIAGILSDRLGRVPVYRGFAILQALSAFPVWYCFSLGNPMLSMMALALALGVASWGMFGTQGALLPEMFGARHRYTAVSLTREVSAVMAGGVTPMVGQFLITVIQAWHIGGANGGRIAWIPLAAYVLFLAVITIATTFFIPEPRNRSLLDDEDVL